MIYDKIDASAPSTTIDGIKYELNSICANDTFKYKGHLVDIYDWIDPERMEMECTFENYTAWKKDLIKLLKTWDLAYVKHMKEPHGRMQQLHTDAYMPMTLLLKSNSNFG